MKNIAVLKKVFAVILLSFSVFPANLAGEAVFIPGNISRLVDYSNFFYNYTSDDFLYYLNDRMLFSEPPDGALEDGLLRDTLLGVVYYFNALKEYMAPLKKGPDGRLALKLDDPVQFKQAQGLLKLLDRKLQKDPKGLYTLLQLPLSQGVDYLLFMNIDNKTVEQQMNRTGFLYFSLQQGQVPCPWSMEFIHGVTGLEVNKDSFFEATIKYERLSLLLAILYRLSDHEIDYITQLDKSTPYAAWKRIFNDRKWLMGMYVLSHGLRAQPGTNRLLLPGGETAQSFWNKLVGDNVQINSIEFLQQLAVKDDGKLNYLYIFSFFLPEKNRQALFFNYDATAFSTIYQRIRLGEKEKITGTMLPGLGDWNFFTLLYALHVKDGKIDFPGGANAWLQAIKGENVAVTPLTTPNIATIHTTPNTTTTDSTRLTLASGDPQSILWMELLDRANPDDAMNEIRRFMAIYTKFYGRTELMTDELIALFYHQYKKYNGLVDVIEKIPLKNPAVVSALFKWTQKLEELSKGDELLFTAIYQSVFEILSFTAAHGPKNLDYDLLVSELIGLPLERAQFFPAVMQFFQKRLRVREKGDSLVDVAVAGVKTSVVQVDGIEYRYQENALLKKTMASILASQEGWGMDSLMELHRLLEEGLTVKPPDTAPVGGRLTELFHELPIPAISKNAPKAVLERMTPYSAGKLKKLVRKLVTLIHTGGDAGAIRSFVNQLRGDYLIYALRDHLMILAYGFNAGSEKLKLFTNPNFVRLHDFEEQKGLSLWDNYGQVTTTDSLTDYYLSGPLSRLHVLLASRWQVQWFRENILHNITSLQALVVNLRGLYPFPDAGEAVTYMGMQVDLGLDLLRRCPEEESVARAVSGLLPALTSGYHYRQTMQYIEGKAEQHNLFFSEVRRLAERIVAEKENTNAFNPSAFPAYRLLKPFFEPALSLRVVAQLQQMGSSYFHTFGNLKPVQLDLFPQELGNLFSEGWLSGALVDEYKVKFSHHLYKKQISAPLLGRMLFDFIAQTGGQFLRQNHVKDYPISYLVFDILNNSHIKRQLKQLQKDGGLNLK